MLASPRARPGARIPAMTLAVLGVLVAACSTGASPSASTPAISPSASVGSSPSVVGLEGPTWQLGSYEGPDGGSLQVPEGLSATATFANGMVGGKSGCNSYTGPYTVAGDGLSIGQLAVTSMACEPAANALETAYLAALGRVATWATSGDTLELRTASGTVALSFTAMPAPDLTGAGWVADAINTGTGATSSTVGGATVTAVFGVDGAVSGSGGCNDYHGSYTIDGSSMTIGPVAATKKACADAAVQQQEDRYFAALERVATWAVSGEQLELRDADGALLVRYAPAAGA
jgi:heat shock protein HslJ